MHLATRAIVCAVRAHGEHGVVARLMTPGDGLLAGYVAGGRSRRIRPALIAGNVVAAEFRARSESQLASLSVELVESRAPLLAEPLPAAAIEWACAFAAEALPEGQPYPALHAALDGVLAAVAAAPSARGWAVALVRFETLAVAELGYGEENVPALPPDAGWPAILAALDASGAALHARVLAERRTRALDARERLVARLARTIA